MNKAAIGKWMRAHPRTRRTACVLLIPVFIVIWLIYVIENAIKVGYEISAEWREDFWG